MASQSLTRRSLKKNSGAFLTTGRPCPSPSSIRMAGPIPDRTGFLHAMRQGRVWKKHPLGAAGQPGLPHPAEPAFHETRLSLGLQSNAPPKPSDPRERTGGTIPRGRDEESHGHVCHHRPKWTFRSDRQSHVNPQDRRVRLFLNQKGHEARWIRACATMLGLDIKPYHP